MSQTTLLVFARAAGLVFRAPGFAHPSVPPPVRVALALALAAVLGPLAPAGPALDGAALGLAIAAETLFGAALGLGAALVYDGAYAAGRLIDEAVGVHGTIPSANVAAAQGFGRLWSSLYLIGFLSAGYVPVVRALALSIARVPPGAWGTAPAWSAYALALPATFVQTALLVAMPALAAVAAVHLGAAAVGRVVPRLANLALASPAAFAAALLVTLAAIPVLVRPAFAPHLVVPFVR